MAKTVKDLPACQFRKGRFQGRQLPVAKKSKNVKRNPVSLQYFFLQLCSPIKKASRKKAPFLSREISKCRHILLLQEELFSIAKKKEMFDVVPIKTEKLISSYWSYRTIFRLMQYIGQGPFFFSDVWDILSTRRSVSMYLVQIWMGQKKLTQVILVLGQ